MTLREFVTAFSYPIALLLATAILSCAFNPFSPRNQGE